MKFPSTTIVVEGAIDAVLKLLQIFKKKHPKFEILFERSRLHDTKAHYCFVAKFKIHKHTFDVPLAIDTWGNINFASKAYGGIRKVPFKLDTLEHHLTEEIRYLTTLQQITPKT